MLASPSFFDCNTHIGCPSKPQPNEFTDKATLLAEWDRLGIAAGLTYHVWAQEWCPEEGNQKLLAEIADEPRLFPLFVALPGATREMPPPEDLANTIREAHGAVRLFPVEHSFRFAPWCSGDLLAALEAAGVPVEIDIAQTSWDEIAQVLAAFPRLHVIVLNVYYRIDRLIYPLWEKHATLHVESHSYQTHRGIEAVCERFGPDRIVFGTDLPVHEGGGAIAQIQYAEIGDDAKAAIASGTMRGLLGLDGPAGGCS
jgi:predicted TIM-barrel fold metal-dependent hydrolase